MRRMGGMHYKKVGLIISLKKIIGIRGMDELGFLHDNKV